MATKNYKPRCEIVIVDAYFDFFKDIDYLTIVKRYGDNTVKVQKIPSTHPSYDDIKMSLNDININIIRFHHEIHNTVYNDYINSNYED